MDEPQVESIVLWAKKSKKGGVMKELALQVLIENRIYLIRGQKVMVDRDLARLYGVATKRLNEQVKRNSKRFPADFMFQLSKEEVELLASQVGVTDLRSHFATSSYGGLRYLPYVFTEQGVAMLSSVLKSERAIQVNIAIMRVFVKIREMLANHKELASKLRELENKVSKHDEDILTVFEAIRQLMTPLPVAPKRRIGFRQENGVEKSQIQIVPNPK